MGRCDNTVFTQNSRRLKFPIDDHKLGVLYIPTGKSPTDSNRNVVLATEPFPFILYNVKISGLNVPAHVEQRGKIFHRT